jgi:hypothetical protein
MESASSATLEQERGHYKGEQEWGGWFGDRGEGAGSEGGTRGHAPDRDGAVAFEGLVGREVDVDGALGMEKVRFQSAGRKTECCRVPRRYLGAHFWVLVKTPAPTPGSDPAPERWVNSSALLGRTRQRMAQVAAREFMGSGFATH